VYVCLCVCLCVCVRLPRPSRLPAEQVNVPFALLKLRALRNECPTAASKPSAVWHSQALRAAWALHPLDLVDLIDGRVPQSHKQQPQQQHHHHQQQQQVQWVAGADNAPLNSSDCSTLSSSDAVWGNGNLVRKHEEKLAAYHTACEHAQEEHLVSDLLCAFTCLCVYVPGYGLSIQR